MQNISMKMHFMCRITEDRVCLNTGFACVQVRMYVEENISLCEPNSVHICDGSEAENSFLLRLLLQQGTIKPLPKYDNW
jgi:GTP-dependent phosphoenolpyruvate carboxykinase